MHVRAWVASFGCETSLVAVPQHPFGLIWHMSFLDGLFPLNHAFKLSSAKGENESEKERGEREDLKLIGPSA